MSAVVNRPGKTPTVIISQRWRMIPWLLGKGWSDSTTVTNLAAKRQALPPSRKCLISGAEGTHYIQPTSLGGPKIFTPSQSHRVNYVNLRFLFVLNAALGSYGWENQSITQRHCLNTFPGG